MPQDKIDIIFKKSIMEPISILFTIGIAVLGYFLLNTMGELKTVIVESAKNKSDIALLKQETGFKHDRLEEKLDELRDSIHELTTELKTYNQKN